MGPTDDPILQIHITRRCNLRCLHCYSSSGPEERDQLPSSTFERAITDARSEGYGIASFSGGEPTLYKSLPELLRHAKSCGMHTTVTSNGMQLKPPLLERLAGVTNVLAISLDGTRESHNRMRNSERAFDVMLACLPAVRASKIPFGFIFTLTQYNLDEAASAAAFAYTQGATLFQIHPLEEVGRATRLLQATRPDDVEAAYAYLEVDRLRRMYEGRMFLQFDLIHTDLLRKHPERFFDDQDAMLRPLADLVSPLVIEADGRVVPFGYGFPSRYELGSLTTATLPELAETWRTSGYPKLQDLCRDTYQQASQKTGLPIFNWWEKLGEQAAATNQPSPPPDAVCLDSSSKLCQAR